MTNASGSVSQRDRDAVRRLLAGVRQQSGQSEVTAVIFGSKARGEAGAESDLDLLVILDRDDLAIKRGIFDLAFEVFLETDVLISPLVLSQERLAALKRSGRRLIRDIERDGVAA